MKTLYLVLCLALLAGCGSSDKAPETFSPASGKGLAIGTITFEADKPVNDIYRFFYGPVSGDKKFRKKNNGKVLISARNPKGERSFNGEANSGKTYLVVIEREPGSYAFTQYNYLDHIGPTGMVSSSKLFSIPFEVKKGAITYFGDLSYDDLAQPGWERVSVSDKLNRDLASFKTGFPGIDFTVTSNGTPTTGDTGGGIVKFSKE